MSDPTPREPGCASPGGCTLRGVFRWTALAGGALVLVDALMRSPPDPWGIVLGAALVAIFRFTPARTTVCTAPDSGGKPSDEP